MKNNNERGVLTEKAQEIAKNFYGFKIAVETLRLYPYLDFVWKNGGKIDVNKINVEELQILLGLANDKHIELKNDMTCKPTRKFYDHVQNMLAETYVIFSRIKPHQNQIVMRRVV